MYKQIYFKIHVLMNLVSVGERIMTTLRHYIFIMPFIIKCKVSNNIRMAMIVGVWLQRKTYNGT